MHGLRIPVAMNFANPHFFINSSLCMLFFHYFQVIVAFKILTHSNKYIKASNGRKVN
ncbi:uncharacterized protein DS421_16g534220 [Arachis hypogaea]|nr:uncharacterized protein DS421_16g534220 [Arachis hypogaea]